MAELQSIDRASVLQRIADTPATLEFRAIALEPGSAMYQSGGGVLLVDEARSLACASGSVKLDDVSLLFARHQLSCELLADELAADQLRPAIRFQPARILTLDGAWKLPPADAAIDVRPLADDTLEGMPDEVQQEVARWRGRRTIFAAFVAGKVVSVGYAPWLTETLADVSIDTHGDFQRRGIGRQVVARVIDDIVQSGRTPVWGATEDNDASLRLAARLGFRHGAGRLFVGELEKA